MRQLFLFNFLSLASLALVAGLAGCASKEDIGPAGPCATPVTVRLCYGRTTACPTEHTTLELSNSKRLRPSGKVWQAYLPKQKDGQMLSISYNLTQEGSSENPESPLVTLTCLEEMVFRCGTM
ncbi:hypothetical protein [Hymenobacter sp. B1770]|uniref:hypothetical protein n=1 Tax=Hymenobacter sp. B1770 TaxID=1718788 RepID=UPI003CF4DC2D